MSVVPHSFAVVAACAAIAGPMPKGLRRACRANMTKAVLRLEVGDRIEPFDTVTTDVRAHAVGFLRTVCATCGKCKGV